MLKEKLDVKQTMKDLRSGKPYQVNRLKIEFYDKAKDTFKIYVFTEGDESEEIMSAKRVRNLLKMF